MVRATMIVFSLLALGAVPAVMLTTGPAAAQAQKAQQKQQAAPSASEYVRKAGMGDLFEIESSRIALQKGRSDAVKSFATKMVDDHSNSTRKLKQALGNGKATLTPPMKLDAPHQKMVDQLRTAGADAFDRLYLQMQLKGHQDALQLHRSYAKAGDNAALKSFASEVAPVVESHLAQLQKMAAK